MSKTNFKQIEALSIGDVVTKHPELVGVFMKYKVDFCCGGDRNVIEAIQKVDDNGSNSLKDSPSAQDVANWLKDNFGSYDDETIVGKNDLFNTLAKIVQRKVNPTKPIIIVKISLIFYYMIM